MMGFLLFSLSVSLSEMPCGPGQGHQRVPGLFRPSHPSPPRALGAGDFASRPWKGFKTGRVDEAEAAGAVFGETGEAYKRGPGKGMEGRIGPDQSSKPTCKNLPGEATGDVEGAARCSHRQGATGGCCCCSGSWSCKGHPPLGAQPSQLSGKCVQAHFPRQFFPHPSDCCSTQRRPGGQDAHHGSKSRRGDVVDVRELGA